MSRKHNATRNNTAEGKKTPDRTVIYVALIGLVGTVITAFFGWLNTRTQILLPLSLTQVSLTQTLLPTKTSIPDYVATPGVCGNGIIPAIGTPLPVDSKPTLVVVTIDEDITWLTLENVLVSLDNSLQMGDRVIILVDGKEKFSDAVITDETVASFYVEPSLPPSPTPYPTTTPTQVYNPITTLQKKAATATAQAAMIQATQISELYLCSAYQWNYSYQTTYSIWQQENVSKLIESLRQKIQGYDFGNPPPTKSQGLIIASNIFDIECQDKDYKKCIFVPMTVMQEWRNQPTDLKVDFSNVNVVGTMTDCSFYDSTCRDKVEYWQSFFTAKNAKSVQFVNLNDFWNLLASAIRQ